jgi:hypothetical protein
MAWKNPIPSVNGDRETVGKAQLQLPRIPVQTDRLGLDKLMGTSPKVFLADNFSVTP